MRFFLRSIRWDILCILVLPAAAAPAAIVTYPDLPSFLSAGGPVALESFEQLAPLAFESHPPTDFGTFTITSDGPFGVLTTGPTMGQHPTEGTHYLAYNARSFLLTFAEPIQALSLDFIDFGDVPLFLGQTLSMTTAAGDSFVITRTVANGDPPNGNVFFFAFTSDVPLTGITFQTVIGDNMAIDAVRTNSVPEPLAISLWGWGAAGLCARRHRVGHSAAGT